MRAILFLFFIVLRLFANAQNTLYIPTPLTGTSFNLSVQSGTTVFYDNKQTPTYGVNGIFLAPTLIVNQGDSITLNVKNNLSVNTTMHWHGLHVSAMNDGGPHQLIKPNTTWSPSFKVRNNAGTFWYHPHGAGQTELQVIKGIAGMLIVKDTAEASLNLPRTYGVDDIPLIIQSKAFDAAHQFAIASDLDTTLMVNGTLNPVFNAPAQIIRFRILNGSSSRTYNLGLSNSKLFYQIATDGGLKDSANALTRLLLSPGERVEVLVDFSGMQGQSLELKSFASEMPNGIYGSMMVGGGADTIHEYHDNLLNGIDFTLLKFNVVGKTTNPITTLIKNLVPYTPINSNTKTRSRTLVLDTIRLLSISTPNRAHGPFGINNNTFDMDVVNDTVLLNSTEIWSVKNNTLIAHPFHIHDVQFNIIEKSGKPVSSYERGWKDVVLVMPNDSVKFIAKFDDFADIHTPYMYHCHLLHHEDDGMMGSFVVVSPIGSVRNVDDNYLLELWPNPTNSLLTIRYNLMPTNMTISVLDVQGNVVYAKNENAATQSTIDLSALCSGLYSIHLQSNNQKIVKKFIKIN